MHWLVSTCVRTVFLMVLPAVTATAQSFPTKPIRVIMPAAPGSTMDSLPRMLGVRLQEVFGQPIVVENRPGANNVIGSDYVAKSPPDGHTLVITTPQFAHRCRVSDEKASLRSENRVHPHHCGGRSAHGHGDSSVGASQ